MYIEGDLDWVGRMPVITLGLAGLAVSVSAFGVSKTFLFALFVRWLSTSR